MTGTYTAGTLSGGTLTRAGELALGLAMDHIYNKSTKVQTLSAIYLCCEYANYLVFSGGCRLRATV